MKKWIVLLLSVVMVLGLVACGSRQSGGGETKAPNASKNNDAETAVMTEPSKKESGGGETTVPDASEGNETETAEPSQQEGEDSSETATSGGKTLVVCYSASGNTEEVANYIASAMEGDLFKIVPTEIYTDADLNWTDRNRELAGRRAIPFRSLGGGSSVMGRGAESVK